MSSRKTPSMSSRKMPTYTAGNNGCVLLGLALATFYLGCWGSFQDRYHFPSSLDKLSASSFLKHISQSFNSLIFFFLTDIKKSHNIASHWLPTHFLLPALILLYKCPAFSFLHLLQERQLCSNLRLSLQGSGCKLFSGDFHSFCILQVWQWGIHIFSVCTHVLSS